ncbi:MAG: chemotaxis protein CheB [Leptospirillia bacterium]
MRALTKPKTLVSKDTVRVLVVDDSFQYRMFLRELVARQPDMAVVGEAGNGLHAAQRIIDLEPDVVLMDVAMPGLDGVDATRLMRKRNASVSVIVVSAFSDPAAEARALNAGATAVHHKAFDRQPGWNEALLASIRACVPNAGEESLVAAVPPRFVPASGNQNIRAVLMGASTGGPQALAKVLSGLPKDMTVPVIIVAHVADSFGDALATWLSSSSGREVRVPERDEPLSQLAGQVLLAPSDVHLEFRNGWLIRSHAPLRNSVRPSVDILFESAAQDLGGDLLAVLLTGMGRDGAEGLITLEQAGAVTLLQNRQTCAVFGMPGEALRLGSVGEVLPVDRIAHAIIQEMIRSGTN